MGKKRNNVEKELQKLSKTALLDGRNAINFEHEQIAEWLKRLKVRRQLFLGLDERDVWKKLMELNELYDASLRAERARYDALLCERQSAKAQDIASDDDGAACDDTAHVPEQKGKKKQTT